MRAACWPLSPGAATRSSLASACAAAPTSCAIGVLGTGEFSTLPLSLFVANVARITLHQERAGLHAGPGYDYEIPAFLGGGLAISTVRARATVGVRGTFWVDAVSMDLMRIEEHAVDVPPQVGMREIVSTVGYARMRIGDSRDRKSVV